jgi:hypothetical protein
MSGISTSLLKLGWRQATPLRTRTFAMPPALHRPLRARVCDRNDRGGPLVLLRWSPAGDFA